MANVEFYEISRGWDDSLDEALQARGIPCLDPARVQQHKQDVLSELRPGLWRYFYVLPYLMTRIINASLDTYLYVSFVCMLGGILVGMTFPDLTPIDSGTYFACGLAGLIFPALVYTVTLLVIIVLMLTKGIEWFNLEFGVFGSYWERAVYIPALEQLNLPHMPSHIQKRAASVQMIYGAQLYVEYLREDPFLVVTRGWWLWREEAYIGAWMTGTTLDQI